MEVSPSSTLLRLLFDNSDSPRHSLRVHDEELRLLQGKIKKSFPIEGVSESVYIKFLRLLSATVRRANKV